MTIIPRSGTVWDVASLAKWAKAAAAGDQVIYHVGDLATDRRRMEKLDRLAETIGILHDTDFIGLTQRRLKLLAVQGYSYCAIRTGRGYAPRGLMTQRVTAENWRVMGAILNRPLHLSAVRAVRDSVLPNETAAVNAVEALLDRGWLEQHPSEGIRLTTVGLHVLT